MLSTATSKKNPFVLSVNGMIVKETLFVIRNLSGLIEIKIEETLPQVHGWDNVQIALAVARFYFRMIRRARLPSTLQDRDPDRVPRLGLSLAQ